MNEMTLREVCKSMNVSRRAIQGYEKANLVSASKKNDRGYLIYDIQAQQQIKLIKLYQRLGFSLKEIQLIIDIPNDMLRSILLDRIHKLENEIQNIQGLIQEAYQLIDTL